MDALESADAPSRHDRGGRGRHFGASGQDCEGENSHGPSSAPDRTTKILQYFKSIEQVATSQGFGQALMSKEFTLKKRDSVLEKLDSPRSPQSKSFLAPAKPPLELTRSITPELVPDAMHTRSPDTAQGTGFGALNAKATA